MEPGGGDGVVMRCEGQFTLEHMAAQFEWMWWGELYEQSEPMMQTLARLMYGGVLFFGMGIGVLTVALALFGVPALVWAVVGGVGLVVMIKCGLGMARPWRIGGLFDPYVMSRDAVLLHDSERLEDCLGNMTVEFDERGVVVDRGWTSLFIAWERIWQLVEHEHLFGLVHSEGVAIVDTRWFDDGVGRDEVRAMLIGLSRCDEVDLVEIDLTLPEELGERGV